MTLRRPHAVAITLGVVLAVALIAVPACKKKPAEVTSKWPRVDAERSVPRPEESPTWPMTGKPAPDAAAALARVVSVKVENSPAARPQSGLQAADVVYEMLTEGGISRFNALFHSQVPEVVAPVRSARMPDLRIVPQYDAVFAYSGANPDVLRRIRSSGIDDMEFGPHPAAYFRGSGRPAPHNLFVDVAKLRREASAKGYEETSRIEPLAFSESVEETASATSISIPFSPANRVEWEYDSGAHAYARTNNGAPHTDAETGKRLTASNVVVMWVKTMELNRRDVTGSRTLDMELTGKNRATVFRDGVRIDGTWEADEDSPPVFRAKDGTLMRLKPGNTWLQVVPNAVNISFE